MRSPEDGDSKSTSLHPNSTAASWKRVTHGDPDQTEETGQRWRCCSGDFALFPHFPLLHWSEIGNLWLPTQILLIVWEKDTPSMEKSSDLHPKTQISFTPDLGYHEKLSVYCSFRRLGVLILTFSHVAIFFNNVSEDYTIWSTALAL